MKDKRILNSTGVRRLHIPSELLVMESEESSLEQFEDEASEHDPSLHLPTFDTLPTSDDGAFSIPTPGGSDLIDISEASHTSKGSFNVSSPKGSFEISDGPWKHLSARTVQNSVRNVLGRSRNVSNYITDNNYDKDGDDDDNVAMEQFMPLHIARPQPISENDRCITPQSWKTAEAMTLPLTPNRGFGKKFPSAPVSPMSPMSKVSLRTARSETYFHTYKADPMIPPNPVPPFVVVHSTGHAFVKVTPKGNNLSDGFFDEDQRSTSSSTVSWRSCLQPIAMLVTGGILFLAVVTVAAGLIKARQDESREADHPSATPAVFSNVEFPTAEPFSIPTGVGNDGKEVIKIPYEETFVPTEATTRPPRTFPPTRIESGESYPTIYPTSLPDNFLSSLAPSLEENAPWNNYVLGLLAQFSPDTFEELDDPDSPQFKALKFLSIEMAQEDPTFYSQDSSLQRFALLCFWFATGGNDWKNNASWLDAGSSECTWEGITCDGENYVTDLYFAENDLIGSIPPEIKLLKNLQTLSLPGNLLGGRLPAALAESKELLELNVSRNSLTGSLPEQFGSLDLLRTLDVSQNSLTGTVPTTLGQMINLEVLNLCANDFSGSIPSQIGSLSFLQSLNVGENQGMTGVVPEAICDLGSLVARGNPPDVVVDCSVQCECCAPCCGDSNQSQSLQSCCEP
ncbi:leucine rich repeat LRR-containing protein [Nitzschia inconspicua]|uniref:Leucine rich repeat LRR-containing protein n=1 Tax=Nitzschia inconspicua TaxID=303405 RepID=A0A9K3Q3Z9_9STRA|nr:leucine rich repeat LRR-containing protein [Nitzschia inconspicua]